MSDPTDQGSTSPAPRGEAAWKAAKDRVEQRNAEARKAGKQRRETYERQREEHRRGAEGREEARFIANQPPH
jgi:hypothetical protein